MNEEQAIAELRRDVPPWTEARARKLKRRLESRLADERAPRRSSRARAWLLVAAVLALASAAYAAVQLAQRAAPQSAPRAQVVHRAMVHPRAGAELALLGAQPDEVVRAFEGEMTIEVAELAKGERFRVLTADAEIETSYGSFDVQVAADRLALVRVITGQVEVRLASGEHRSLHAGERFSPPPAVSAMPTSAAEAVSSEAPVPSASLAQPRKAPAVASSSARRPSTDELAFQEAWASLQKGDYASAAKRLEQVQGDAPIAEDAAFWRAIALSKGGDRERASQALENFMSRYPSSRRRGEVEAALTRRRVEQGAP